MGSPILVSYMNQMTSTTSVVCEKLNKKAMTESYVVGTLNEKP